MVSLRNATALFSQYEVSTQDLKDMKKHCRTYLSVRREIMQRVTPTAWTIGHVVPAHANDLPQRFCIGLGLATAQGKGHRSEKVCGTFNYQRHLQHDIPVSMNNCETIDHHWCCFVKIIYQLPECRESV